MLTIAGLQVYIIITTQNLVLVWPLAMITALKIRQLISYCLAVYRTWMSGKNHSSSGQGLLLLTDW